MTTSRIRILIAEDHDGYAKTLAKLIENKLGPLLEVVQIEFATRLDDALRLSQACDVSIVDMELEGTTPEDTEREIPHFRKPMIVLTAHYSEELEVRCLALGAHAVFDKSKFEKLIEALLLAAVHGIAKESAV